MRKLTGVKIWIPIWKTGSSAQSAANRAADNVRTGALASSQAPYHLLPRQAGKRTHSAARPSKTETHFGFVEEKRRSECEAFRASREAKWSESVWTLSTSPLFLIASRPLTLTSRREDAGCVSRTVLRNLPHLRRNPAKRFRRIRKNEEADAELSALAGSGA